MDVISLSQMQRFFCQPDLSQIAVSPSVPLGAPMCLTPVLMGGGWSLAIHRLIVLNWSSTWSICLVALRFHSPALPHPNIPQTRHQRPTPSPFWTLKGDLPFFNSQAMRIAAHHQFFSRFMGFLWLQTYCCLCSPGSWYAAWLSVIPWVSYG